MGRYVKTFPLANARPDLRWKGISLAYRVCDKDQQRVTHAASPNKRLSGLLAYAMALQQATAPNVPPAGKQRSRCEPMGKKPPGCKNWPDKHAEQRAAEAAARHAAERAHRREALIAGVQSLYSKTHSYGGPGQADHIREHRQRDIDQLFCCPISKWFQGLPTRHKESRRSEPGKSGVRTRRHLQ